jgi:hypothetical protein
MTLVVAWVGFDNHGVTSAYISADSRITWAKGDRFDHGRKVFGLERSPDLFGYCGDVQFPSLVLGQISEMADAGLLFSNDAPPETKTEAVLRKLEDQFAKYPADVGRDRIQVLHVSRGLHRPPSFRAFLHEWHRGNGWSSRGLAMPSKSGLLSVLGSGAPEFKRRLAAYDAGPNAGTSRAVFHCFCQTVASGADPHTGGAPQLVGLYRGLEPKAVKYGIISNGERFIFGASIDDAIKPASVEWRNELFEICDGMTMLRMTGAQPQPDPVAGI